MNSFSVFLCFVVAIAAVTATDYCSEELCPEGVRHVACNQTTDFHSNCGKGARMVPLNKNLRQVILRAHNDKRNFIASGKNENLNAACRMVRMRWDPELAETAAYNVRQCAMGHDACHNTPKFNQSGQNIAEFSYSLPLNETKVLIDMIEAFYNEVKSVFQSHIDTCTYSGVFIDHFMVMMVDHNSHVGCATSTYFVDKEKNWYLLLVCNYASIHITGLPVYKSCKIPGNDCKKRSVNYPSLCHVSENYKTK